MRKELSGFVSGVFLASLFILPSASGEQLDSVDVTFSYTNGAVSGVSLVGEFNGWNTAAWPMTNLGQGLWTRTARLPVGVNPFSDPVKGVPGAWQYKFYYTGASPWPNDPLNHHQNARDNNNTFLIVKDPTIYHLLPNQRLPIVTTSTPTMSASIFPKVGATVDTASISLKIDGVIRSGLGSFYNAATGGLSYTWPVPLTNGSHTAILTAGTIGGGANRDTVTFNTQAGFVQITTQGGYTTRNQSKQIRGIVQAMVVSGVHLVRNGTDTVNAPLVNGMFAATVALKEGDNTFTAVVDSGGTIRLSDPISITYVVDHSPHAVMGFSNIGSSTVFYADGTTDPDSGQTALLKYLWKADTQNPSAVAGADGNATKDFIVPKPAVPGDYYFTLIVTDPDGNADTTKNYFTIETDGSISIPTIASNPLWARKGRIYFLFPKAVSKAGTLSDATSKLPYIKAMGFSVIWLMPIMKNASPINNGTGPGYNIVDFYTVADEYGGNSAFSSFMAQAHALGLKVILDITPNHTGRAHPYCLDAHTFKEDSRYWTWYEHNMITSNTNGLGDNLDADGFNYYGGFSQQLMNYNWADIDARTEMINVYKYWIREFGVDGYRFDVYWGPHRRYGEAAMGKPVREALKHIKPDILLLAEDNATGAGSEVIFADYIDGGIRGGIDAAYDFNLYWNGISNFAFDAFSINSLHNGLDNNGYYPGKNALFMRYLESQDEDRIVYFYSGNFVLDATTTFMRTMPLATVLFTAPGLPMLWNGQEVGWGYGITGSKEARSRSVIDWDYQGKALLSPHYQKLALIRGQFPAFTQHRRDTNGDGSVTAADSSDFVRVNTGNDLVYAFTRPYNNQNGLTVVNVTPTSQSAVLRPVTSGGLKFIAGVQQGRTYYLNNLYTNVSSTTLGSELDSIPVTLPAYGTAIYTVSTTFDSLRISTPVVSVPVNTGIPHELTLWQNFPNPFNPVTIIRYQLPTDTHVSLKVYDLLGREVAVLVNEREGPGLYSVRFDGSGLSSGVYFYRLIAGAYVETSKMVLMR